MTYTISGQQMTDEELKTYADTHELSLFEYEGIEHPVRLISNDKGYITAITRKGNIIQDWAGFFKPAI